MCQEMERLMCKFWWKMAPNKTNNIHWMSWKGSVKRKQMVGLVSGYSRF